MPRSALGLLRTLLKRLDILIDRRRFGVPARAPVTNGCEQSLEDFLVSLDMPDAASAEYLRGHLHRLVRTLSLVPPGRGTARALELGSYMQMAPALAAVLGYASVRGAYYGAARGKEQKRASVAGKTVCECAIDLFDAERDEFPYADASFDLVLCCELIEHLLVDPMQMLFETYRVLADAGTLVVTTPNCASFSSVACVLHGWKNPQIYSCYPGSASHERPHVREYTPGELTQALVSAGFAMQALFTERAGECDEGPWVRALLEQHGFDTSLRGEQVYCVARKQAGAARVRYPRFLYGDAPPDAGCQSIRPL